MESVDYVIPNPKSTIFNVLQRAVWFALEEPALYVVYVRKFFGGLRNWGFPGGQENTGGRAPLRVQDCDTEPRRPVPIAVI